MWSWLLLSSFLSLATAATYSATAQRVNRGIPLFSHNSIFNYSYNAAFVPAGAKFQGQGLLVRCQDNSSSTPGNSWWSTTPSQLAFSEFLVDEQINLNEIEFAPITKSSVVISPEGPDDNFGDEDPRIVYRDADGLYYLLYSSVVQNSSGVYPFLSLATATDPSNPTSWVRQGPLFPYKSWSKSGALLLRDDVPGSVHYLFWGDSSLVPGMQYATSSDLKTWVNDESVWLPIRKDNFDSQLVEGGPMPLRLSDGNYFFLYNSARPGYPSPNPNYSLQYNVGWVVLDKDDPTKILQRSDVPLLSPQLAWEVQGLTANVVFVEGWFQLDVNTFLIFYGAADTDIGTAVVKVQITP